MIHPDGEEYREIRSWPFADPFVARLLRDDIPQRVQNGATWFWIYLDPQEEIAGFGSLQMTDEHERHVGRGLFPYIPLLAANPNLPRQGHGSSILRHLIGEAATHARMGRCLPLVILDVYVDSEQAIRLYDRFDFEKLIETPIPDADDDDKPYFLMAKGLGEVP